MFYTQVITKIIVDRLKETKDAKLDETTLGYRLYPFALSASEAVELSKGLIEQCQHLELDVQLCLSIKEDDDAIANANEQISALDHVHITNSKAAAEKATLYRNDDELSNTVYISYKQWGKEGGLKDTLENLLPLFGEEEQLKAIEAILSSQPELYLQLLSMYENNNYPRASIKDLCYILDAVAEVYAPGNIAAAWKKTGEHLFRLGLPADPYLSEENASKRVQRSAELLCKALGETVTHIELTTDEKEWLKQAENKLLFEQNEEAVLHISLPEKLTTENTEKRGRPKDTKLTNRVYQTAKLKSLVKESRGFKTVNEEAKNLTEQLKKANTKAKLERVAKSCKKLASQLKSMKTEDSLIKKQENQLSGNFLSKNKELRKRLKAGEALSTIKSERELLTKANTQYEKAEGLIDKLHEVNVPTAIAEKLSELKASCVDNIENESLQETANQLSTLGGQIGKLEKANALQREIEKLDGRQAECFTSFSEKLTSNPMGFTNEELADATKNLEAAKVADQDILDQLFQGQSLTPTPWLQVISTLLFDAPDPLWKGKSPKKLSPSDSYKRLQVLIDNVPFHNGAPLALKRGSDNVSFTNDGMDWLFKSKWSVQAAQQAKDFPTPSNDLIEARNKLISAFRPKDIHYLLTDPIQTFRKPELADLAEAYLEAVDRFIHENDYSASCFLIDTLQTYRMRLVHLLILSPLHPLLLSQYLLKARKYQNDNISTVKLSKNHFYEYMLRRPIVQPTELELGKQTLKLNREQGKCFAIYQATSIYDQKELKKLGAEIASAFLKQYPETLPSFTVEHNSHPSILDGIRRVYKTKTESKLQLVLGPQSDISKLDDHDSFKQVYGYKAQLLIENTGLQDTTEKDEILPTDVPAVGLLGLPKAFIAITQNGIAARYNFASKLGLESITRAFNKLQSHPSKTTNDTPILTTSVSRSRLQTDFMSLSTENNPNWLVGFGPDLSMDIAATGYHQHPDFQRDFYSDKLRVWTKEATYQPKTIQSYLQNSFEIELDAQIIQHQIIDRIERLPKDYFKISSKSNEAICAGSYLINAEFEYPDQPQLHLLLSEKDLEGLLFESKLMEFNIKPLIFVTLRVEAGVLYPQLVYSTALSSLSLKQKTALINLYSLFQNLGHTLETPRQRDHRVLLSEFLLWRFLNIFHTLSKNLAIKEAFSMFEDQNATFSADNLSLKILMRNPDELEIDLTDEITAEVIAIEDILEEIK